MAAVGPYRAPDTSPRPVRDERIVLVAKTLELDLARPRAYARLAGFAAVVMVAVATALRGNATICIGASLGAVIIVFVALKVSHARLTRATVRVREDKVDLSRAGHRSTISFSDLTEVTLASGSAPATPGYYVEFKTERGSTPLLEYPISLSECAEWIPVLHRFLRSNGWVPKSERGAPESTTSFV